MINKFLNFFKKIIIYIYHKILIILNKNNWSDLDDVYSRSYMASPDLVDRFIFFSKIDYELAKSSNQIIKKSIIIKHRTNKSEIQSLNPGFVFINFTDSDNGNQFLLKCLYEVINTKKITNIYFRFHPRYIDKKIKTIFCSFSIPSQEILPFDNKLDENIMEKSEFIITAVSSAITAIENYVGTIYLSRNASLFLNNKQFVFFSDVLEKNISAKLEIVE